MTLAEIVAELVDGWREHIEYVVKIGDRFEKRSDHRMQPSLIQQLKDAHYHKPVIASDSDGGRGTKVHADIPGNLLDPDEILCDLFHAAWFIADDSGVWPSPMPKDRDERTKAILRCVTSLGDWFSPDSQRGIVDQLMPAYRRARLLLGYDDRWVMIAGTVCGDCDGQLRVERTAPKVVRCCACPKQYHYSEWIRMATA